MVLTKKYVFVFQRLNSSIIYDRDYTYNYFGFKVRQPFQHIWLLFRVTYLDAVKIIHLVSGSVSLTMISCYSSGKKICLSLDHCVEVILKCKTIRLMLLTMNFSNRVFLKVTCQMWTVDSLVYLCPDFLLGRCHHFNKILWLEVLVRYLKSLACIH